MIKLVTQGHYQLIETQKGTKILVLDKEKTYAWVNASGIGEILVATHKKHEVDHILAMGKYRLYDIKDEPKLTDLQHLELLVGHGTWQGYLLPSGLPSEGKKRNRLVPTDEVITLSLV